jgi:hypothetical protein
MELQRRQYIDAGIAVPALEVLPIYGGLPAEQQVFMPANALIP